MHVESENPCEIDETRPSPRLFKGEDRRDYLAVIERDIRDLMLQLAEQRLEHTEASRQQDADMQSLLLNLINDLSDSFERVFGIIEKRKEHLTPKTKIWIGNFHTIYKLLHKILSERDIVPIENLEKGFDPNWHKVVETVEDPTKEDGTILEEVKKGYLRNGIVLRKTEVVVVRNG